MPAARIAQRVLPVLTLAAGLFFAAGAVAQTPEPPRDEVTGKEMDFLMLPKDVSTVGHEIDLLFEFIFWMTFIVGVAVFVAMIVFLVKYRYRPDRTATYIHGNARLELVWTIIPALLMAATAAISQATWKKIKAPEFWPSEERMVEQARAKLDVNGLAAMAKAKEFDPAKQAQFDKALADHNVAELKKLLGTDATLNGHIKRFTGDVIHLEVIAKQFSWMIHYPGPDGKLGPRRLELMKGTGQPDEVIGLDKSHPDSADDFVTERILVVPVNKMVYIDLSSKDVLHSFFLPNFRLKQDAVPGLVGNVWFEATRTSADVIGRVTTEQAVPDQINYFNYAKPYDIVCAELCGANHYAMKAMLYVVTEEEHENYIAANVRNVLGAAAGGDDDYGE